MYAVLLLSGQRPDRNKLLIHVPTMSCIASFYHTIPGSCIYACLYSDALLRILKQGE